MKHVVLYITITTLLLLTACGGSSFKTADDGVTIKLRKSTEQAHRLMLRIQVLSTDIFRVSAIPSGIIQG